MIHQSKKLQIMKLLQYNVVYIQYIAYIFNILYRNYNLEKLWNQENYITALPS